MEYGYNKTLESGASILNDYDHTLTRPLLASNFRNLNCSLYVFICTNYFTQILMNVLIPVRTTAAQIQHVLILLEAITVPVTVVILEMASHVKVLCT